MPFKLLKLVSNANSSVKFSFLLVFLFLKITSLIAQAVVSPQIGYRGPLLTLQGQGVSHMVIRSDGRYMFYSTGSQLNTLDLLDMGHTGTAVATGGTILNLQLDGDQRLIVVTTATTEYYNITSPLAIVADTASFIRPADATSNPIGACVNQNKQIYYLEVASSSTPSLIRIANASSPVKTVLWSSLFNSNIVPLTIRCAGTQVLLIGTQTDATGEIGFWVGNFGGDTLSGPAVNISQGLASNYTRSDFIISESKDQLLVLYNRKAPVAQAFDNAKVAVVSVAGLGIGSVNLGYYAKSMLSYFNSTTNFFGFFVGLDTLASQIAPPADVFLFGPATGILGGGPFNSIRGPGISPSQPVAATPSQFTSSARDHYKYMVSDSGDVMLISQAPCLQFAAAPQNPTSTTCALMATSLGVPTLTGLQPLSFNLVSDENINFEIRFDDASPDTGEPSTGLGITTNFGRQVKAGTLSAGQAQTITISAAEAALQKTGLITLAILGTDPTTLPARPVARLGLNFNYTPPPGPVQNFHLGIGDQSVHAFFKRGASGGAPDHYNVYFSYDPNTIMTPQTIQGAASSIFLTSPVIVSAASFRGDAVIAPVQNYVDLWVTVEAVDALGQVSANNPAPLSMSPMRTRSLAEALGGPKSCALSLDDSAFLSGFSLAKILCLFLGFIFSLGILRRDIRD